ncbi:MAG: archaeosortase H [Promethearchaeota archaeon]
MSRKGFNILLVSGLTFAFAYSIGFTIPLMESLSRENFGIVMIPLLVLLNFIIVDKFEKDNLRDSDNNSEISSFERPIIEFENKKYVFSNFSLILFGIGAPISAYLIYLFFDIKSNYWLHELVIKQTVYFLNLFFNMGVTANYLPIGTHHWNFGVPGQSSIYFETFCTGVQAICVFAGLITFIPHSMDHETRKDIVWRKTKSLIMSAVIFYAVNILRMIIQIYLYYVGYPWDSIHVSISAASSFIAAIIILLLHKWIPEFIISIIYVGTLFSKKFKSRKNKLSGKVEKN